MKNAQRNYLVDDEAIEQLVDGRLTGDRYREVLRALEASSDGWRRCALAFLEEQALTQDLRSLSRSGFNLESRPASAEPTGGPRAAQSRLASDDRSLHNESWKALAGKLNVLSLAASILFAFSIGWFGGGVLRSPEGGAGRNLSSQSGVTVVQPAPRREVEPSFDPPRFVLESNKPFVPIDRQIPEQLLELERRGIVQIETIDGIVPFELEDGRAAIIPVQNFRVRPVMFAY